MPTYDPKEEESKRSVPIFPDGTYKVRLTSVERTLSKKNTPQLMWKASIEEPVEHKGRSLVIWTTLSQAAMWKVHAVLSSFGVDAGSNALNTDSPLFNAVCNKCVGRTAMWRNVQARDPNGNLKNEIVQFHQDPDQDLVVFQDDTPKFATEEN